MQHARPISFCNCRLTCSNKLCALQKQVPRNSPGLAKVCEDWVGRLRQVAFDSVKHDLKAERHRLLADLTAPLPEEVQASVDRLGIDIGDAVLLLLVRSGSYMYNLHTKTSDEDYIVIFLNRASQVCSLRAPNNRPAKHVHKAFGADKSMDIEFSGVEFETFLADLCKGNPRNIEPLYTDRATYINPVRCSDVLHVAVSTQSC